MLALRAVILLLIFASSQIQPIGIFLPGFLGKDRKDYRSDPLAALCCKNCTNARCSPDGSCRLDASEMVPIASPAFASCEGENPFPGGPGVLSLVYMLSDAYHDMTFRMARPLNWRQFDMKTAFQVDCDPLEKPPESPVLPAFVKTMEAVQKIRIRRTTDMKPFALKFFAGLLVCALHTALFAGSSNGIRRIAPTPAIDLNDDPQIVQVELTAQVARVTYGGTDTADVWTYNAAIPGPMIEANVGDLLIVNFTNNLPEETTIHWHGVILPAVMDGSHISQRPIAPGGTYRYEFRLLHPGLFWYHHHIRTNIQVELGLHAPLLVHDPAEAALELPQSEHVLVLDDVLLDESGKVADPFPVDPLDNATTQVNGRHGNTLLVNGKAAFRDTLQNGIPHRFRVVNVSNSRFMRISIPGHRLWRIGGDGGLLESPIPIEPIDMIHDSTGHNGNMISNPDPAKGILLTPGERADFVFTPMVRDSIVLEWHDWARGRHSASYDVDGKTIVLGHDHSDGKHPPQILAVFYLQGDPATEAYVPPQNLRTITPVDTTGAVRITSTFGHSLPDSLGNITFFAQMKNGMPLPMSMVTPDDAPKVTIGDRILWEVHNLTAGDHNFHLHGFHFQLLETEFVDMDNESNNARIPAPYLEDKDTILLPRRPGAKGRSRTILRLALDVDDNGREGQAEAYGRDPDANRSGGWLFHCHILEHSTRGMMSYLQVFNTGTHVHASGQGAPLQFDLEQNYPNPFNPETTIRYTLHRPGHVRIDIFNNFGRHVRTLVDQQQKSGSYSLVWDGRDSSGGKVASGPYYYSAKLDGRTLIARRMLLIK